MKTSVTASFNREETARLETLEPHFFSGKLEGTSLSGDYTACTTTKELMDTCGKSRLFDPNSKLRIRSKIEGTYRSNVYAGLGLEISQNF